MLDEVFDTYWSRLVEKLSSIPAGDTSPEPVRREREILEEILELVRRQERTRRRSDVELSRLVRTLSGTRDTAWWDRVLQTAPAMSPDFLEYIVRRNAESKASGPPIAPPATTEAGKDPQEPR